MGRKATHTGIGPKKSAEFPVRETIDRSRKMYRSAARPASRIAFPPERNPTYAETAAMPPTPQRVKLTQELNEMKGLRSEASEEGKRWKRTRKQNETTSHLQSIAFFVIIES